jgi:phage-related protein
LAAEAGEKVKIEALITHVEKLKGAKFIRNGKAYEPMDAARFLRGKWEAKDKEIKTAADFIEKAATVSSTTGKPYLIQLGDGREVKCGEYLQGKLEK